MKILSLFDGVSCARVALDRAGIPIKRYYASEIDKHAIQIAQKNYPDTVHLGGVADITADMVGDIDIIVGGSPCQDLSIACKNRKGLDGDRSGLVWEYVRLLKEIQPTYFVLENVNSMSQSARQEISMAIGFTPIMLNAALFSAQSRKRLFWVGKKHKGKYIRVTIPRPVDRGIMLKDILHLESYTVDKKAYPITATYSHASLWNSLEKKQRTMVFTKPIRVGAIGKGGQGERAYFIDGKSITICGHGGGHNGIYTLKDYARILTPIECERLQGLPDNFTEGIAKTHRYKCLGNAFNVDVVAHIFKEIKRLEGEKPCRWNGKIKRASAN